MTEVSLFQGSRFRFPRFSKSMDMADSSEPGLWSASSSEESIAKRLADLISSAIWAKEGRASARAEVQRLKRLFQNTGTEGGMVGRRLHRGWAPMSCDAEEERTKDGEVGGDGDAGRERVGRDRTLDAEGGRAHRIGHLREDLKH